VSARSCLQVWLCGSVPYVSDGSVTDGWMRRLLGSRVAGEFLYFPAIMTFGTVKNGADMMVAE
jgi:hypothetical protein